MTLRGKYVLSYVAALLIGFGLMLAHRAGWGLVWLFVSRLVINFWYGKMLNAPIVPRLFASVFSSVGFMYLMGYSREFASSWSILTRGVQLYEKHFKSFFAYAGLLILANVGLAALSFLVYWLLSLVLPGNSMLVATVNVIVLLAIIVAFAVANVWLQMALAYSIQGTLHSLTPLSLRVALRTIWGRLPTLILTLFLKTLAIVGPVLGTVVLGVLLVKFPNTRDTQLIWYAMRSNMAIFSLLVAASLYSFVHLIYFSIRLLFAEYAVIFENTTAKAAFARSSSLTQGKWWLIAWRLMACTFVVSTAAYLLSFALQIFTLLGDIGNILYVIFYIILQILFLPASYIVLVLLFEESHQPGTATPPSLT